MLPPLIEYLCMSMREAKCPANVRASFTLTMPAVHEVLPAKCKANGHANDIRCQEEAKEGRRMRT